MEKSSSLPTMSLLIEHNVIHEACELGWPLSFGLVLPFCADRCAGANCWRLHHARAVQRRPLMLMGTGKHLYQIGVLTLGSHATIYSRHC